MNYRKLINPTESDLRSLETDVSQLVIAGDFSISGVCQIAKLPLERLRIWSETSLSDQVLQVVANIPTLRLLNVASSVGFHRPGIEAISKSTIETLVLFGCFELTDMDLEPL